MNDNAGKLKKLILMGAAAVFVLILSRAGLLRCPLNTVFGIPCPSCGITRALISVFHGDMAAAFFYHPLWPVIVSAVILFALCQCGVINLTGRAVSICCIALAVLLTGCYIIRHLQHSPVVALHFKTSLLYRILEFFRS